MRARRRRLTGEGVAEWKGRSSPPPDGASSAAIALSKPLTPSELPLIAARPFVPGAASARGGAGDVGRTPPVCHSTEAVPRQRWRWRRCW